MARLRSELELSLVDRVSPGARRIEQNLENLRNQSRRSEEMFNRHRNALAGTGIAAYALARTLAEPIQASIQFSTQLEDIRQKADLTSEAIARIGRTARDVGLETAQGAGNMAGAIDSLVASGAVTPEQAEAVSLPLGKTATAYRADPTELANLTSSVMDNLNVPVDEIERVYEILAKGGKEGKFELKDMAAEFPALTAAAAALGIEGEKGVADLVAALQVAMKGAGSGSEAATNMANYMQKILAPDALKKFSAQGIDMVAELNRAVANGESPIEHSLGILDRLTKGGQQDLLGQYFADSEVQKFIRPLLENLELYTGIRDRAMDSAGMLETDFLARMETPQAKIDRFMASVDNLNIAVGDSLVPALARFVESVTPMIDSVASFTDANQELVAAVVEITAALIGLRLLASASGMAGALLGLNGSKGGLPFGLGGSAGGSGADNKPGGRTAGKGLAWWGFAGFNAIQVAQDYLAAGDGIKVRQPGQTDEDWAAQTKHAADALAAQNQAINDMILAWDVGGIKPFQELQDRIIAPTGGIGGGYTGPQQGEIDALKGEIAKLDAEIAEWPEQALEERRARLAEKLAAMEAELAASGTAVTGQFAAMMEQLRIMAAAGVSIPVQINGPRALSYPRMIDAPGNYSPPSMPASARPQAGPVSNTTNVTVGDVNLSNPTNANPQQIGRAVGQQVADRVRASHSNGGM